MPTPDIRPIGASLHLLPIATRVPLKFGAETTTHVTCARVRLEVETGGGQRFEGWGETPLSVQWVWPSRSPYEERHGALVDFTRSLAAAYAEGHEPGHALEVGHRFLTDRLGGLLEAFNRDRRGGREPMPWLAALVCASAFDLALHDAYGAAAGRPAYACYGRAALRTDLGSFLEPAEGQRGFAGRHLSEFLAADPPRVLRAWHLVGGRDPVGPEELTGDEPDDGHPVLLRDWIRRDGLKCLKVKLRGDDEAWDRGRLRRVGAVAVEEGVDWLSADFNCTVGEPAYVTEILDWLMRDHPRLHGMLLYVEQPFPYELRSHPIDVHAVSARKPLFLDESAHGWCEVRYGRELGWTGVALKTCKTQTGALLSLAWAKAHGMTLMVQDLTNPMLAQISHVQLAAHAGTIMGVETNAMQFYPEASAPEAKVHPGLYRRRDGMVDWSSCRGPGFGYRINEIDRRLPEPDAASGSLG